MKCPYCANPIGRAQVICDQCGQVIASSTSAPEAVLPVPEPEQLSSPQPESSPETSPQGLATPHDDLPADPPDDEGAVAPDAPAPLAAAAAPEDRKTLDRKNKAVFWGCTGCLLLATLLVALVAAALMMLPAMFGIS